MNRLLQLFISNSLKYKKAETTNTQFLEKKIAIYIWQNIYGYTKAISQRQTNKK